MFKKVLAFALGTCLVTVTALAAYGTVCCDVMMDVGSEPRGYSDGYDWCSATAIAEEASASSSKDPNIYARASVVGYKEGTLFKSKEALGHDTKSVRASIDKVIVNWALPEIAAQAMGLARTRYIDGTTSEAYGNGTVANLGGHNARSTRSYNKAETLGFGKGNNTKQVINEIFGYDLTDYSYVSFGEVWTENNLNDTLKCVRSIASDIFVSSNEGDHLPLGFLYNDNSIFTITEKENGEVVLTEYQIPALNTNVQSFSVEKANDESQNCSCDIVNELSKSVDKNRLAKLYH